MTSKYKSIIVALVGAWMMFACNDDFMQRDPITEIAEGSFLTKEGDLEYYLNGLYSTYIQGYQSGWAQDRIAPFTNLYGAPYINFDKMTDNLVLSGNVDSRLDNSYVVPTVSSGTNNPGWSWGNLRSVNYFLRNYKNALGSVDNPAALNKWAAEAYFFKAWDYYTKVLLFGDVPWLEHDLNIDSPELFEPRTPRAEVMDSVLSCINFAVRWLPDNGTNPNGRINRDMANFLKARIGLFEGSFRTYHKDLGLPAEQFLNACVEACEAIIASGHYTLYTGAGANSYWKMFTFKKDPVSDGNTEAILARTYDGEKIGHCTQRYYEANNTRFSQGATRGLVDEYLCKDGLSVSSSPLFLGYDGMWSELENRDPRLTQSIAKPGENITIYNFSNGVLGEDANGITYPRIGYNDVSTVYGTTVTGYWVIKHWMGDVAERDAVILGQQTAVEFRYGEVLLMLAEAKVILGTITQNDIDRTINALRQRAGFDFDQYPSAKLVIGNEPADARLDAIYADKLDYPVSPLLREIRRERRVELFQEGRRYEDLMRWKAGNLYTVPLRGMKFTDEKEALYDGSKTAKPVIAPKATINSTVFVDDEGFIIAYPQSPRISNGTLPWDNKRYYWPIPLGDLRDNPNLTQSKGWEDISR